MFVFSLIKNTESKDYIFLFLILFFKEFRTKTFPLEFFLSFCIYYLEIVFVFFHFFFFCFSSFFFVLSILTRFFFLLDNQNNAYFILDATFFKLIIVCEKLSPLLPFPCKSILLKIPSSSEIHILNLVYFQDSLLRVTGSHDAS